MKLDPLTILIQLLVLCVEGFILTYIWNGLIPTFPHPILDSRQGIGILFGIRLIFRNMSSSETALSLKRIEDLLYFQIQMTSLQITGKLPTMPKPDEKVDNTNS